MRAKLPGPWTNLSTGPRAELYGVVAQAGITAAAGVQGALLVRTGQLWSATDFLEGLWVSQNTLFVSGGQGTILSCPLSSLSSCATRADGDLDLAHRQ